MAKRFLLRALVALLVYCSVVGTFFWSPRISGKVTPYLHAVLTESIDFDKVRRVVSDLFSYPDAAQQDVPYPELYHRGDLDEQ